MDSNIPKITDNATVNFARYGVEHRGAWMARMYKEMQKYLPQETAEKVVRDAISAHGYEKGCAFVEKTFKGRYPTSDELANIFSGISEQVFEVEVKERNDDTLRMEFGYCPLVTAWRKLGCSQEECEKLCDMAMDGDRNIAAGTGHKFTLGKTVAEGHCCCEILYERVQAPE